MVLLGCAACSARLVFRARLPRAGSACRAGLVLRTGPAGRTGLGGRTGLVRCAGVAGGGGQAGEGVGALEEIEVDQGPQVLEGARDAGRAERAGGGVDVLGSGQDLVRRQFAAGDGGVAGVLLEPGDPGLLRGRLPAPAGGVRVDHHHDPGAQPAQLGRGQAGRRRGDQPVGLGGVLVRQALGGLGDDLHRVLGDLPVAQQGEARGQAAGRVTGLRHEQLGGVRRDGEFRGQLVRGEEGEAERGGLHRVRLAAAGGELGDRRLPDPGGVPGQPAPGRDHAQELVIGQRPEHRRVARTVGQRGQRRTRRQRLGRAPLRQPGQVNGRAGQADRRAGQVSGRAGQVSGRAGRVSGRAGRVSGRAGRVSGRAGQVSGRAGRVSGLSGLAGQRPAEAGHHQPGERPVAVTPFAGHGFRGH